LVRINKFIICFKYFICVYKMSDTGSNKEPTEENSNMCPNVDDTILTDVKCESKNTPENDEFVQTELDEKINMGLKNHYRTYNNDCTRYLREVQVADLFVRRLRPTFYEEDNNEWPSIPVIQTHAPDVNAHNVLKIIQRLRWVDESKETDIALLNKTAENMEKSNNTRNKYLLYGVGAYCALLFGIKCYIGWK
jgi:hypothetical protein